MKGGKQGLLVNSRNVCGGTNRSLVKAIGHNGKHSESRPVLRAKCPKRHGKRRGGR